jgi:hypothetical protein
VAEHGRRDLFRVLVDDEVAAGDDPDRDRVGAGARDAEDGGREERVVVADDDEGGDVEAAAAVPTEEEPGDVVQDEL